MKKIGIYINFEKPTFENGLKVWRVGRKKYIYSEGGITFHDFIRDVLIEAVGSDWVESQKKLSAENQHFIVQCISYLEELRNKLILQSGKPVSHVSVLVDGRIASLQSLAFDVYSLLSVSNIPSSLLARLRIKDQYQGARYEILVAAIMLRLGFTIDWLDEKNKSESHCEFIATHNESSTKIAVEAKTRRRPGGILHTSEFADLNDASMYKGDVQRLLRDALKKPECGKMSYIVFIDVNVPVTKDDPKNVPWMKDILNEVYTSKFGLDSNLSECNAIYFTNLLYNYHDNMEPAAGQNL